MSFNIRKYLPRITPLPAGCKISQPEMILATWFGSGRIRPAAGTMGTIAALPFGYGLQMLYGIPAIVAGIIIIFAIGVYVAGIYDRKDGGHDSSTIVIDEVVGMWIAAIPAATHPGLWITAFILFRLFDIWKPWPVSLIDRHISGGLGVMLDDVAAGILAFLGTATVALSYFGGM